MIKTRIKIFTSTKASLLEEKLNEYIEEIEKRGCLIENIETGISYAGEPKAFAYMAIGTIVYTEEIVDDFKDINNNFNLDFGIGESNTDCPSK